jgi:hypothetical protein
MKAAICNLKKLMKKNQLRKRSEETTISLPATIVTEKFL